MSMIQGYFGSSAQHFINHIKQNSIPQTIIQGQSAFAIYPNKLANIGEQSCLFSSPDKSCIGVFSGNIFDYSSLIAHFPSELVAEQKLALFLQNLYQQYGSDFPRVLKGFFSIFMAIDGQMLAVRDAIGERPVYILQTSAGTVVANKMSPLIRNPDCTRKMDPAGISDFLSCGFLPFNRTPVANISKLPPGSILISKGQTVNTKLYHALDDRQRLVAEEQCVESIKTALYQAVDMRFETGHKTALLLSGGLDSSLVGAILGRERLDCTYSLNFGDQYRHELEYSGLMARHLGVPAHIITVTPQMIKEKFAYTAEIIDEPIGDPLTVPNIIVAEAAAQEAQQVFNGEGGDPIFGGPKNLPLMAFEAYRTEAEDYSREDMYLRSYNKGHEYLSNMLTSEFQQLRDTFPTSAELLQPYFDYKGMDSRLHRLMHINLRLKGAAQILPKVFKAASAAGFAIRSPLFDQNLAELAFNMPPAMKLQGSVEKYILKQAVADIVPGAIINRPKSGMLVPVHFWFQKELKSFAKAVLLNKDAKISKLIVRKQIENLLAFKGGGIRPYYGDRIWLLLSLEFWMQAHHISSTY